MTTKRWIMESGMTFVTQTQPLRAHLTQEGTAEQGRYSLKVTEL